MLLRPISDVPDRASQCLARARVAVLEGRARAATSTFPPGRGICTSRCPVEDRAFLMALRTRRRPDSTGLTHVLEHLVMCGSERYPCRRAFFAMLGRTLSTTMNALTTEDCTAYHFATRSLADYENLLSVYRGRRLLPASGPDSISSRRGVASRSRRADTASGRCRCAGVWS